MQAHEKRIRQLLDCGQQFIVLLCLSPIQQRLFAVKLGSLHGRPH